jgi:hypothetical protein
MDATSAIALSSLNTAAARIQGSAERLARADFAAPASNPPAGPSTAAPAPPQPSNLGQGGVQAQLAAAGSDVDPAREAVEQVMAVQQYRASVALLKIDDRMQKSALDLLS